MRDGGETEGDTGERMKEQLKMRLNRKFGVNYGETGRDCGEITEVKKKQTGRYWRREWEEIGSKLRRNWMRLKERQGREIGGKTEKETEKKRLKERLQERLNKRLGGDGKRDWD